MAMELFNTNTVLLFAGVFRFIFLSATFSRNATDRISAHVSDNFTAGLQGMSPNSMNKEYHPKRFVSNIQRMYRYVNFPKFKQIRSILKDF